MLAVGARVRLHGLQAKPELNGCEGVIKERKADSDRWTVKLADGTDFAFKGSNLEVIHPGYGAPKAAQPAPASDATVLEGFEKLLGSLETTRRSVFGATVYLMDHAAEHATVLAQRLVKALGKSGLGSKAYMARLYVVSDVIHNSKGKREGASQVGASLQELLPEACEKLGRIWLRRIESQEERDSAEAAVRDVLGAWQGWSVFPPLFVRGLESLLFAQVNEITAKEAGGETDERLRQKLTRWFAGINQVDLPQTCRQRGLAGKALAMATCRARLCHFERYWHLRPGVSVRLQGLLSAPHLNGIPGVCEKWDVGAARWKIRLQDGTIKAVKQDNLVLDESHLSRGGGGLPGAEQTDPDFALLGALAASPGAGAAAGAGARSGAARRPRPGGAEPEAEGSIDGEPLSEEELAEIEAMEAEQAEKDGSRPMQCGYGVWTQVYEPKRSGLLMPADYDRGGRR